MNPFMQQSSPAQTTPGSSTPPAATTPVTTTAASVEATPPIAKDATVQKLPSTQVN